MQITKPLELVGKEIYDAQGMLLGKVDKYWSSWNKKDPGCFFGIRLYENVRDSWFRGTGKLIPICSSYIKEIDDSIYLDTIIEELSKYWTEVITINDNTYPIDSLMEQGLYDKNGSRIGTLFGWVKTKNDYQYYGCLVDPYLIEKEHYDCHKLLPIKSSYLDHCSDSVKLNVSLNELKRYWKQQSTVSTKKKTTKRKTNKTAKKTITKKKKTTKK